MIIKHSSSTNIAKNPIYHDRTKHVEIGKHFIREKIVEGTIYTPSSLQTVDILTKALPTTTFDN